MRIRYRRYLAVYKHRRYNVVKGIDTSLTPPALPALAKAKEIPYELTTVHLRSTYMYYVLQTSSCRRHPAVELSIICRRNCFDNFDASPPSSPTDIHT